MVAFEGFIDFCYSAVLLLIVTMVGWRYLRVKSVEISWHLLIIIASLPLCYCLLDSIGVLVFAVIGVVVYRYLPAPRLKVGDKAVLITGCDSGFGHAAAIHLDRLGFRVFAGCLLSGGEGEHRLLESCSERLTTLQLDVTDQEQVDQAFLTIRERLDGQGLWGLVNNAGIYALGNIELMPLRTYECLWNVNCLGMIRMTKRFLPLIRREKGRIVNISSIAGRGPMLARSAYCMSKAAVEMMSDILRQEMRQFGVRVSILEPIAFQTDVADKLKMRRMFKEVTDNLSEDVRADFDVEDYARTFQETIDNDLVIPKKYAAGDLGPVVEGITDALLSRHPRCRYMIGRGALLFTLVAGFMPSHVYDFLMCSLSPKWLFIKPRQGTTK